MPSEVTVSSGPAQVPALGPWALPGVALVMSAIATFVSGPYVPSFSRASLSGGSSAFPSTREPDPNLGTQGQYRLPLLSGWDPEHWRPAYKKMKRLGIE